MKNSSSKAYKRSINKSINKFNKDLHQKLRSLQSKNPREYWQIINHANGRTTAFSKLSCEIFAKHFKDLNTNKNPDERFDINSIPITEDSPLNILFSRDELLQSIRKLKNGKACGIDVITDEFIKYSFNVTENIHTQFFNLVLTKCILPEEWVIDLIRPIYKKRGSRKDPDNYRGITLLSCMGKLFTFMLNERLKCFININGLSHEEQTGFRNDYSTIDHIFSLSFIVNIYLSK